MISSAARFIMVAQLRLVVNLLLSSGLTPDAVRKLVEEMIDAA